MKHVILAGCLVLGASGAVLAIEAGPSSPAQQQTETWLQLQVKGDAASKVPQSATPTEREQSLQRWLDNNHKIPEFYDQKAGGKASSGGGQ